jgi:hypothetical protein
LKLAAAKSTRIRVGLFIEKAAHIITTQSNMSAQSAEQSLSRGINSRNIGGNTDTELKRQLENLDSKGGREWDHQVS